MLDEVLENLEIEYQDTIETILWLTKDILNSNGFIVELDEIYYRGFGSQGDGASFDFKLDIPLFIKANNLKGYTILLNCIKHRTIELEFFSSTNEFSTHYCHEKTRYTDFQLDIDDTKEKRNVKITYLVYQLKDEIENQRLDICKTLYKSLQSNYESYQDELNEWET